MATEEGSLLKQTLMSHSECFVYKVPPLATASGYRANDWNLASPLETCGFQVERRNNDLYLLFTLENHTKLFALSKIEGEGTSINNINVETVMDSSRYFVCKILQSNPNDTTKKARTALLGFGFREREIAIDLLGNLQQFRQSIDRELEAKDLASKTKAIPTLAEGEKIHISLPGGKGKTMKSPRTTSLKGSGGTPILLKKPPPSADGASLDYPPSPMSPFTDGKRFSLSAMECPMTSMTLITGPKADKIDEGAEEGAENDADDDSAAAQAHTVMDDLMSVEEDLDIDAETNDDGVGTRDDQSEGAVGGATVNDDDSSADSFQFSELNLDDLDETDKDKDKDETAEAKDDDDFGDFQAA